MSKPIVVSGIQPTGNLHIGNYLGAVKNWLELQNSGKYDLYIFIADLHSLTGKLSAQQLRDQVKVTVAELLAAGIDPNKTTFFVQSHVQEHTELAWLFNCVTLMNELDKMTQFKEKAAQQISATAGLFTYPILQAADILLYKGALVPVGQDQIQHVELTRDIARWFNNKYSVFFPETKHLLTNVPKVMSLLEPEKKMSKSLGAGHVIDLCETPENIENKLKKAVTATVGGAVAPGVSNLLGLLKEFGDKKIHEQFVRAEKQGDIRYGDLKKALSDAISCHFTEFRKKRSKLLEDSHKLDNILAKGAKKAQKVAKLNMIEIRKLVGIR